MKLKQNCFKTVLFEFRFNFISVMRQLYTPLSQIPGNATAASRPSRGRVILNSRVGFLPWQKVFLPGRWKKPAKTGINCGWHSKVWDDNLIVYSQTFNTEYNNNSSKTAPLEVKQQDLKVPQKYKTSLKSTRKVKRFLTAD